jgi:phytol kinase
VSLSIAVLVVFILLCVSEMWWRQTKVHGEISRKFVHITVGTFVAFWPFFLSWHEIELLSIAFLIVVSVSKHLNILKAIHSVQRPTWGEVYFALAVGSVALIAQNRLIYMTALLQMSLADGLAAIMGMRYGKKQKYLIFGQVKSIVGSFSFMAVSYATLLVYSYASGLGINILALLLLAVGATLIENIGVFGLDNLFVPILIASMLRIMS